MTVFLSISFRFISNFLPILIQGNSALSRVFCLSRNCRSGKYFSTYFPMHASTKPDLEQSDMHNAHRLSLHCVPYPSKYCRSTAMIREVSLYGITYENNV